MQDITGRFALPLVDPFSEVPPPYGRRRKAFVKSRRPGLRVFDFCPHGSAPQQAKTCAADFGSDNRAWLNQNSSHRPSRSMLAVGLAFAALCSIATHMLENKSALPSPDTIYRGAISVASVPAPTHRSVVDASDSRVVKLGGDMGIIPKNGKTHLEPVPDAIVPKASVTSRQTRRPAEVQTARTSERHQVVHSVLGESVADVLGMTDAEFARWREATRDTAPSLASNPAEGAFYFHSTEHPRLISY